MELLAIKLAKHSSLERARTMQRNFIAKWLAKNPDEPEGAIVGFYDDEKDWRFSFVKLEYNLIKDEKGNLITLPNEDNDDIIYDFNKVFL